MLRVTLVCRTACELVHRRTRLSDQRRRCTFRWFPFQTEPGSNRCSACNADLKRVCGSGSDTERVPKIGNYRLPKFAQGEAFNSFLFQTFGCEVMMCRSWYIQHNLDNEKYCCEILDRYEYGNAYRILWGGLKWCDDENVTDETVDNILKREVDGPYAVFGFDEYLDYY